MQHMPPPALNRRASYFSTFSEMRRGLTPRALPRAVGGAGRTSAPRRNVAKRASPEERPDPANMLSHDVRKELDSVGAGVMRGGWELFSSQHEHARETVLESSRLASQGDEFYPLLMPDAAAAKLSPALPGSFRSWPTSRATPR